jgi:hypothetical protein
MRQLSLSYHKAETEEEGPGVDTGGREELVDNGFVGDCAEPDGLVDFEEACQSVIL